MPRRPPTTGYARIAQAEEEYSDDDSLGDDLAQSHASLQPPSAPRYASITQPRPHGGMWSDGTNTPVPKRRSRTPKRTRSNSSGVDIKAINARLEKWADEIAAKFKIGKVKAKSDAEEQLEIHYSVFQAPEGVRPYTAETLASLDDGGRMTKEQFDAIVESVNIAIEQGIHPKMISQGSSGSYFARNSEGKTVGVFKPKDEEPYAAGNPKWNKWIHRNLFPCFFGRACLIPNLSYVSEAAAYTLDCQLRTNLVPYTDIVHLSSKSFHYDYWARRQFYRKRKPFPPKPGSFQVFLQGFSDANVFLRKHPWPDQLNGQFRPSDAPKRKAPWHDPCRPSGVESEDEDSGPPAASAEELARRRFFWTDALQKSFREELEKLVILDYIMRNTDRGLDNWMIKVDWESQKASIVSDPPQMPGISEEEPEAPRAVPANSGATVAEGSGSQAYRQQQPMRTQSAAQPTGPVISLGAIDNSLSWPWKHPDAWRSFPFGWLFLPVTLIGQPFSQATRDHFLPLLTSKQWWSETQLALRKVFSQDVDFQEGMFARQIAVMKGQAWNVVETLKIHDHGPLELTRRNRVCVWDDLVDIPVAVPMHSPSVEMHTRREPEGPDTIHEEMDLGVTASAPAPDLLGLHSPSTELPNPNRFELSNGGTPRPSEEVSGLLSPQSPAEFMDGPSKDKSASRSDNLPYFDRPKRDRWSAARMSYSGPTRSASFNNRREGRRFSLTSRISNPLGRYDGDDLEGDLGYAAAEGMEGHQRKVIVERLETIKGRNPVFSWC
jgi:phosphatidylinositol 4-kinase type 2